MPGMHDILALILAGGGVSRLYLLIYLRPPGTRIEIEKA